MEQSDDERVISGLMYLPLGQATNALTVRQSAHEASEQLVQQAALKSPSLLEPTFEEAFFKSKNMFVSLPPLHFEFPVMTLVAEQ